MGFFFVVVLCIEEKKKSVTRETVTKKQQVWFTMLIDLCSCPPLLEVSPTVVSLSGMAFPDGQAAPACRVPGWKGGDTFTLELGCWYHSYRGLRVTPYLQHFMGWNNQNQVLVWLIVGADVSYQLG